MKNIMTLLSFIKIFDSVVTQQINYQKSIDSLQALKISTNKKQQMDVELALLRK